MKKILITGGCGFVGTNLTKLLLKKRYKVTVIDTQWFGNYLPKHKNLTIIKKDIRTINKLHFDKVHTVFHLASISNDPSSELNPKLSWEVGPLATFRILEICKEKKVRNFIFASSGSVYGISKKKKVDENTKLIPISDYNKQKMVVEKLIENYSKFFRTVIVRPATVCGYSPRLRLDLSVNLLTYQAYKNKIINVFGGNQIRPNIHIDDMVSLYHFLLENNDVRGTFNAGFENLSIKSIAKNIKKHIKCKLKVSKSNDLRSYRLDSSKLLSTGYKPKKNVEIAIKEMLKFFKEKKYISTKNNINLQKMQNLEIK
tara:strand:+ start:680 stop:1621 length:942 start_codon:yes stop_codon:yes gene_type:complete